MNNRVEEQVFCSKKSETGCIQSKRNIAVILSSVEKMHNFSDSNISLTTLKMARRTLQTFQKFIGLPAEGLPAFIFMNAEIMK